MKAQTLMGWEPASIPGGLERAWLRRQKTDFKVSVCVFLKFLERKTREKGKKQYYGVLILWGAVSSNNFIINTIITEIQLYDT